MIPKWMLKTDEGTWQGHLVAGLVAFWPGYGLSLLTARYLGLDPLTTQLVAGTFGVLTGFWGVVAIFAYREGDNMWAAAKKLGARMALRRKGLDGIGDFLFPIFGVFADINLLYGGLDDFIVSLVAAEVIWLLIAAKKRGGLAGVKEVFRDG